jgi:hypothetical protein
MLVQPLFPAPLKEAASSKHQKVQRDKFHWAPNCTCRRDSKLIKTDPVILVAIELEEHNIAVLLGQLLKFRCYDLARAAPTNESTGQSLDYAAM